MMRRTPLLAALALCFVTAGCATSGYGPLTFNRSGADFYFSQDGQFARTELGTDGTIDIYLKNAPFQLGHNGRQLNLALAQIPISEISTDPKGFKASRLSGPMAGGHEEDMLLVYSGQKWTDGNTAFLDATSRKASPMPGYRYAYQVNKVLFLADEKLTLETFKGTVHGFIVVYKQHERKDRDIMPVRLIFG